MNDIKNCAPLVALLSMHSTGAMGCSKYFNMEINSKKTARVFFALWPNEGERAALAAWQSPLKQLCGGRMTPPEKLHNTLVFLGDVPLERLEALQLAAQEVSGARFEIAFDAARYWGHNHVVYAEPASVPTKLSELVSKLAQSLHHHRFVFDKRSYKPHVTLLRHAHWTDQPLPLMQEVAWQVGEFALVQSLGGEQGAGYEILARFTLKPNQD